MLWYNIFEEINMKRILCYGDSNTWGYISGSDHLRYNSNERWPKLLQKKLGQSFEIIEEGLNSRTLFSNDDRPGKEGRNGFTYLKPCMDSHDKFDTIIIMLGTNELKSTFNNTAEDIVNMIDKYVNFIKNYKSQIDKTCPGIIISGLPIVQEDTTYSKKDNKYKGATQKSIKLNNLLEKYCKDNLVPYINNDDLTVGIDGVHLTKESHISLANRLSKVLTNNLII